MDFRFKKHLVSAIILIIVLVAGCSQREPKDANLVTLASLLDEMTDREAITRFPRPGYKLKQASSYDRSQSNPQDNATWFNNVDYNHYIRMEEYDGQREYVIMEEDRPGCITRWWIPLENTYKNRTLRIYLDGNSEPVIQENYYNLLTGKSFIKEPFAFISSDEINAKVQQGMPVGHPKQMGADLYFPIAFAKSCKITLDDNPFYYIINYRIYEKNVRVETFSMNNYNKNIRLVKQTGEKLLKYDYNESSIINNDIFLEPRSSKLINLPSGAGRAIQKIQLKMDASTDKQTLRSTVLQINFDDKQTVWCPVSEFFGGGVYMRPVNNRNLSVSKDGVLSSYWIMPYREKAEFFLHNYGAKPLQAKLQVTTAPYNWDDHSMYFHLDWHEQAPLPTPPKIDWNYINIRGQGVYAGDVLTIHSTPKGWWGEGDEKIYIDGESFPSHLGTGTEDYYGYAWGMAHHFSSPFISTPLRDARGKGDWRGYTTVARMRLLDAIPFNSSLQLDMEGWQVNPGVSYAVACFWYGYSGAADNIDPDDKTILRKLQDFVPEKLATMPGKQYPDPAFEKLAEPLGNKSIRHVGNHLDLLLWRSPEIEKTLDSDFDNVYGTAGYHLIACKRLNGREINFMEDSVKTLPSFIESMIIGNTAYSIQDTWFIDPKAPHIYLITGAVVSNGEAESEKLMIRLKVSVLGPQGVELVAAMWEVTHML